MSHIENPALKRMRAGEAALGMQVRLARTGEIAGLAKATGHDFLLMDMQHSGIDLGTVIQISIASYGFGVAPIVRIPGVSNPDAVRILDAGAMGIMLPDVRTAEEARLAVQNCKFPPIGSRSVTTGYVLLGYQPVPVDQAAEILNREIMVICMIESAEGLRNIEEIAAVDGVDVLHMGVNDLLMDMGLPGKFGCPEALEAAERLLKACASHGKFAGLGGDRHPERQRQFIAAGGRFLTTESDLGFLRAEATRRTESLRAAE